MSALPKLEWAKDSPPVGNDKHGFKKGAKGRLVVVVTVVGFGLLREDWGVAAAITPTTNTTAPTKVDYGQV